MVEQDRPKKTRRNITLDPEVDDKLREQDINGSALIDTLLKAYFAYGEFEEAIEYTHELEQGQR